MATRAPRRRVGLLALPDEVLQVVLSFGDLRARFTCVAASSPLRDAQERLSPAHEHKLLVRRFPMLKPLLDANKTLAPAAIFRGQQKLFRSTPEEPTAPTMNAYTFHLEVELVGHQPETTILHVATGILGEFSDDDPGAAVSFSIPANIWSRAREHMEFIDANVGMRNVRMRAMVSRTSEGFVECARIYHGMIEEDAGSSYSFPSQNVPCLPAFTRTKRAMARVLHNDFGTQCYAYWYGPSLVQTSLRSTLQVCFEWNGHVENTDMTVDETKSMFEQFDWVRM